jgi:hypothetical protein
MVLHSGRLWLYSQSLRLGWKGMTWASTHEHLFRTKYYNIRPWCQCYRVCTWQAFQTIASEGGVDPNEEPLGLPLYRYAQGLACKCNGTLFKFSSVTEGTTGKVLLPLIFVQNKKNVIYFEKTLKTKQFKKLLLVSIEISLECARPQKMFPHLKLILLFSFYGPHSWFWHKAKKQFLDVFFTIKARFYQYYL